MILYQEVKSAAELEGEDYKKKDIFANTYAAAACTTTAAYVEYTIEEIAMVERDEAPVGEQQGFAVD